MTGLGTRYAWTAAVTPMQRVVRPGPEQLRAGMRLQAWFDDVMPEVTPDVSFPKLRLTRGPLRRWICALTMSGRSKHESMSRACDRLKPAR